MVAADGGGGWRGPRERRAMRFGIKPLQGGRNFGTTVEEACLAEALGFAAVYLSEHHGVADGFYPAPFLVAAALAARTHRARL